MPTTKPVILCVDDEKTVLDSLKAQLRDYYRDRFIYEMAEDADEAFEVMEELIEDGYAIIVIVSDWLMPGLKGDEFLIQVHHRFPRIIKLMLTGQADETAIERARREANLLECIHKPWSIKELIRAIDIGLDKLEKE